MNKKILVTGGSGLIGNALNELIPNGIFISSTDYDLRKETDVAEMFRVHRPTDVIHLAGKVGGVGTNMKHPVEFYEDNILMNTLLLRYAHKYNVHRLVSFMSTCVFPNEIEYPLEPHKIHLGEPHFSNFGYAYAKRMIEIQTRAYNTQYNRRWFTVIPTNVYGPHDNYNLEDSHVIPALIHKCYLAKKNNTPWTVWGTGNAIREFIYSKDLAEITLWLLNNYTDVSPIIVSTSEQTLIRSVVESIAQKMNFTGEIIFDTSKPEGQHRKPSDITPLKTLMPYYKFTSVSSGLDATIEWFLNNYEYGNVRV